MLPPSYQYRDNLQSKRLRTRFLQESDYEQWTEFFESAKATELFPDFGYDTPADNAKFWINKQLERYQEGSLGLQSIIDKQTNEIVGQAGLLLQNVDGQSELEVGYHFKEKYWGQGFAPEAAKLFMEHAAAFHLSDSIISIIDTRNHNSIRVAQKNGLTFDKTTTWKELKMYVYRIHLSQVSNHR